MLLDDASDGRLDRFSLAEAALIAAGVDDRPALDAYRHEFDALADQLRPAVPTDATVDRQAQAVFAFLHGHVLRGQYRVDCTDLRRVLRDGTYNCVSATVLFNALAAEVGMPVCALEAPGHVLSRVCGPDTSLDVETTCPEWFRLAEDPRRQAEAVVQTLGRRPAGTRSEPREISSVELVGMVYYNQGVDLLAAKRFAAAAAANAKAVACGPQSTTAWGNLLATLNNWAIHLGHESRYAEAAELLQSGLALDPQYKTFRQNFAHVHHQWTERFCQTGRFAEAMDILDHRARKNPDDPYFAQARADVGRRWAVALFDQNKADEAFAVLDRVQSRDAELNAVNQRALTLLDRHDYEPAIALFDRGLARHPDASLLAENRRAAIMRWAETAFEEGDYAEAIRRTKHGATAGRLHHVLVNNVRYGYQKWIERLQAAGRRNEAGRIAHLAETDPFLNGGN